jgi:hypothetical protein
MGYLPIRGGSDGEAEKLEKEEENGLGEEG